MTTAKTWARKPCHFALNCAANKVNRADMKKPVVASMSLIVCLTQDYLIIFNPHDLE